MARRGHGPAPHEHACGPSPGFRAPPSGAGACAPDPELRISGRAPVHGRRSAAAGVPHRRGRPTSMSRPLRRRRRPPAIGVDQPRPALAPAALAGRPPRPAVIARKTWAGNSGVRSTKNPSSTREPSLMRAPTREAPALFRRSCGTGTASAADTDRHRSTRCVWRRRREGVVCTQSHPVGVGTCCLFAQNGRLQNARGVSDFGAISANSCTRKELLCLS